MGLREIEGLLQALAEADPEEAAGAHRDLRLDRLEPGAARVARGIEEPGQALHPVRLDQDQEQHDRSEAGGQEQEVPDLHPRRHQQGRCAQGDDDGGAQVRLGHHQQAAHPHDCEVRNERADIARHLRPGREQVRAVEDQRELRELGGLNLKRPGADPALRPIRRAADARQHHREQEAERDDQQQARERSHHLGAAHRHQPHDHESDRADGQRSLEVVGAVPALAQQLGRGARAEHHHDTERKQAKGRGEQEAVLDGLRAGLGPGPGPEPTERERAHRSSSSTRERKCSPRSS